MFNRLDFSENIEILTKSLKLELKKNLSENLHAKSFNLTF